MLSLQKNGKLLEKVYSNALIIVRPTNLSLLIIVLFFFEKVPSVLFAPHHLLALFTLGVPSGIVLDCGFTEAIVLPISFLLLQDFIIIKK